MLGSDDIISLSFTMVTMSDLVIIVPSVLCPDQPLFTSVRVLSADGQEIVNHGYRRSIKIVTGVENRVSKYILKK